MKGFSTLEIMIAVVIITITMIAVVQVSLELPLAVTESSERLQATELANSQLQKQFALGLTSFSAVTATATTSLTIENQLYQTSVNVDLEDDLVTKQLTSTVSWINTDGHTESVTLNGLVTDFEHAYPSECPDIASGNWSI
jgi:Tfp pilus assembly protein PilV